MSIEPVRLFMVSDTGILVFHNYKLFTFYVRPINYFEICCGGNSHKNQSNSNCGASRLVIMETYLFTEG